MFDRCGLNIKCLIILLKVFQSHMIGNSEIKNPEIATDRID
jgi:hypothetical protein